MCLQGSQFKTANLLSWAPLDEESCKQQNVRGKLATGLLKPRGLKIEAVELSAERKEWLVQSLYKLLK